MKFNSLLYFSLIFTVFFYSCKKKGCMDPAASNYNANAKIDNGSCKYTGDEIDILYGADPIQQMKLYLPVDHNTSTKVVLMVHGGGWIVGYSESGEVTTFENRYGWDILNPLLEAGYACAVMKYRTACYKTEIEEYGNNTHEALDKMLEDIDLAIDYLKANATDLDISNNHYQLLGESAGGHIVLSYAVWEHADEDLKSAVSMFGPTSLDDYEWKYNLFQLDSLIPEGILVDGINYFRTTENDCNLETNKHLSTLIELRSFGDHATLSIDDDNIYLQDISPAIASNINNPTPIFIMQGDEDALVPYSQAPLMYDAYLSKYPDATTCSEESFNCDLKATIYSNCGHGWIGGSCAKSQIMADIVSWIEQH